MRTSDAVLQPFKPVICYQLHSFFFFKRKISAFLVLLCIYLPALECIVITLVLHRTQMRTPLTLTAESNPPAFSQLLDDSIWSAVVSILKLGGYIIVFHVCLRISVCCLLKISISQEFYAALQKLQTASILSAAFLSRFFIRQY